MRLVQVNKTTVMDVERTTAIWYDKNKRCLCVANTNGDVYAVSPAFLHDFKHALFDIGVCTSVIDGVLGHD